MQTNDVSKVQLIKIHFLRTFEAGFTANINCLLVCSVKGTHNSIPEQGASISFTAIMLTLLRSSTTHFLCNPFQPLLIEALQTPNFNRNFEKDTPGSFIQTSGCSLVRLNLTNSYCLFSHKYRSKELRSLRKVSKKNAKTAES